MLNRLLAVLFSPTAFAIGLLWPLTVQVLLATQLMQPGWAVWATGAALVLPFALMAQLRGSWIWIK